MISPHDGGGGPELTVVVLCYGEEDYIREFVPVVEAAVGPLGVSYEVILVANYFGGSDDRSPEIACEIAKTNPRVRAVAKPKEGMMGWDMRSGLEAARGNVLAVIDGDGQVDPADIARTYAELRAKGLDLCQTYRVRRGDGRTRVVLSRAYNLVFRLLFHGPGLHDVNAKPKVMTRQAYQSLRLTSTDWFIDAEIVIQARRNGLRLGEIPSVFGRTRARSPHIKRTRIYEVSAILAIAGKLVTSRIREIGERRGRA